MIKVHHYNSLTKAERDEINGPNGGWDSSPRFSRYADITGGFGDKEKIKRQVMKALLEGEYHAVAVISESDKDAAYHLTQHLTEGGWMNDADQDRVIALPGDHRSTSVGDLLEDTETGDLYIVAGIGFTKLS